MHASQIFLGKNEEYEINFQKILQSGTYIKFYLNKFHFSELNSE